MGSHHNTATIRRGDINKKMFPSFLCGMFCKNENKKQKTKKIKFKRHRRDSEWKKNSLFPHRGIVGPGMGRSDVWKGWEEGGKKKKRKNS